MKKIYLLVEYGGHYDARWEEIRIASFDAKWLNELKDNHNNNQMRKMNMRGDSYMRVDEFDISDKETYLEI